MLTYSFEDIGTDTLYGYLYKCLRKDILNGTLPAGYKLPSKRSFAKNLNISVITVENAYAQLIAEGYLTSVPKKGYFVSQLEPCMMQKQRILETKKPMETLPETEDTIFFYKQAHKNDGIFFGDFVTNSVKPEHFPFSVWAKLMRELLSSKQKELLTPSPAEGIPRLREAIVGHLRQFRGIFVSPEQIIIGAGTEYLYHVLIQLLGREKIFAVEDPGYRKIAQIYESNGVECRYLPLDQSGIHMESLRKSRADIIHISPSHHYPTGIITPISRRYELLGWASEKDSRYIIEDDYDCEFRLLGKPIPALQSIDVMEKVIFMNTFTKSLTPTIRISYMVLPPHLLKQYREKLRFYSCTVSNFEQYTLAEFISRGYLEKHINRMRNFYRSQRDYLISCIKKSSFSSFVTIREEDAGLHFLMEIMADFNSGELIGLAEKEGIRLTCLSLYFHQKELVTEEAEHTIVINYSGMEPEHIAEAVERLEKAFANARREYNTGTILEHV